MIPQPEEHGYYLEERPVGLEGVHLLEATQGLRDRLDRVCNHIVEAATEASSQRAMTFLVAGAWGTGKSSALKYLEEKVTESAGREVVFARYQAPLYEASPGSVRASLLFEVIMALQDRPGTANGLAKVGPGELVIRAILGNDQGPLHQDADIRQELGRIYTQRLLAEALNNSVAAGMVLEHWLTRYRELTSDPKVTTVLLVDDLDRCKSTEFIKEVLVATNYWSYLTNHFFVLAADEARIRQALAEHLVAAPTAPDHGLAKYVHVTVNLPDVIPKGQAAAKLFRSYLNQVKVSTAFRDALNRHLDAADTSLSVLYPLLNNCTPRMLKERFNSLAATLGDNETVSNWVLKRACLEICWPAEFRSHIAPAELGEVAQVAWCQHLVTLGEAAQNSSRNDIHAQEVTFIEMAKASGLVLDNADPVLALYLAAAPAWTTQTPGKAELSIAGLRPASGGTSAISDARESTPKLQVTDFRDLVDQSIGVLSSEPLVARAEFLAEIARIGDRQAALRTFDEVVSVLRTLEKPVQEVAPAIGNAALRFASMGLFPQSVELHYHAVRANPRHANVCQNFVDFIIDHEVENLYDLAEELLERLMTDPEMQTWKPLRTRILRLNLDGLLGNVANISDELDALTSVVLGPDSQASTGELADLLPLVREARRYELVEPICSAILAMEVGDLHAQTETLRLAADALATSSAAEDEEYAAALYIFMLSSGLIHQLARADRSDTLANLSSLYSSRGQEGPAAFLVWITVRGIDPFDEKPGLKTRLARSLNRLGFSEAAKDVLEDRVPAEFPARITFSKPILPPSPKAERWLKAHFEEESYGEGVLPEIWQPE
jgi:hypothetical protein